MLPEYAKIFKPIAEKHGISIKEVYEMYASQYEFIYNTITNSDVNDETTFKSFRLYKLGVFLFNVSKYRKVRDKIKAKENDE